MSLSRINSVINCGADSLKVLLYLFCKHRGNASDFSFIIGSHVYLAKQWKFSASPTMLKIVICLERPGTFECSTNGQPEGMY